MEKTIRLLLRQYGDKVTLVKADGSSTVRAFLQPIMSKSWQNMQRLIPEGGQIPVGQFLYIGSSESALDDVLELKHNGKTYFIRRVDSVCFQNRVLFHWALLTQGGRDDPWTS